MHIVYNAVPSLLLYYLYFRYAKSLSNFSMHKLVTLFLMQCLFKLSKQAWLVIMLTSCKLGLFAFWDFCMHFCHRGIFFQNILSEIQLLSNSLDPDQVSDFCFGPDLLQFFAKTSRQH